MYYGISVVGSIEIEKNNAVTLTKINYQRYKKKSKDCDGIIFLLPSVSYYSNYSMLITFS